MTISEHIQNVSGAIFAQKNELEAIRGQRKQAGIMAIVWLLIYGAMLLADQASILFISFGFAFLVFNIHRLIRFERAFRLTSVLLSDNERYKEIIVDEAYSGKESEPQD